MLKRRRQTAVNQNRTSKNKEGKKIQSYEPTPNDIRHYERISKFFARAQISKTTHPKLLNKLQEVIKEMPLADFTRAFRGSLRCCFTSNSSNDSIQRIFTFVAAFCAAINNNEEEGNLCPFNAELFTHLLEISGDDMQSVRLRTCQLINALLQSLDADKGLEVWLADAIQESMLKRMKDKSPLVRAQAVSALQRLQDPENPNCPVITCFIESLAHDPCAEVRCRLLSVMARNKRTLSLLVERHTDEKDSVRKAALLVLSRIHMRSLKIAQREAVLCAALQDPSSMVRNCAEKELLPWWLLNNDGDYFRFLGCLDVYTTGPENVCKEALYVLFRRCEATDLVAFAHKVLVDKLLPAEELDEDRGPQKLVYWRSLVQFFRETNLEDDLEAILPNLTPFCVYMRQVLLGDRLPKDENELDTWSFVTSQLIIIAQGYDFADEMGRAELRRTLFDLVAANKCNTLTTSLIQLLEVIEPVVPARLIALAEVVSELLNPLTPAKEQIQEEEIRTLTNEKNKLRYQLMSLTAQYDEAIEGKDFTAAKTLNDQLTSTRERLSEINERLAPPVEDTVVPREANNDTDTLSQCLNIIFEAMQDPKVTELTPELRTLMIDFVEPVFQQPDLAEPLRLLCLKCFGAFCLLDKKVAQEKMGIFIVPIAEEGDSLCAVAALQAIFDMFYCYGVAAFGIIQEIDEREARRKENPPEAKLDINILDSLLFTLRDYTMPALVLVAATGFCKLLLSEQVRSYELLNALMLAWFHQGDTYPALRMTLDDFFSLYTANIEDGMKLMVQCIDPLIEDLLDSDQHKDLDISQVLLLAITLSLPEINDKCKEKKENVHLEMALHMCNQIIEEPEHTRAPYFAQALSRLQLVWASAETLQNLRAKAVEIEPLFADDKLAKRFMTKFIANITAAEAVLAEQASTTSDEDEPGGEEGVNAAREGGDDEEQMEVDDVAPKKTTKRQSQDLSDVIAGSSSSPIDLHTSLSRITIPESDSEASD